MEGLEYMNYIVSAVTDVGTVKNTNQDSYGMWVYNTDCGKVVLAVLCDGMGGLAKGEIASSSLVNAFCLWGQSKLPYICSSGITDDVIYNEWNNIITAYNVKIKDYANAYGISMGTTLTAMLLTQNRYYIVNVGDTRAYELCGGITQMTNDHTFIAREVSLGHMSAEEAESDSRRNILLQCIGASDVVKPDVFCGDIKANAVYMLCSDGFRHAVTENEIYQYMNAEVMTDSEMMRANMASLVELNKQRQERDNITVLAVRTF